MIEHDTQIGFIGGGNMAHAIVGGLLKAGHRPACLHISDPSESQRKRLQALHADLRVDGDNATTLGGADVVVLAVKPQVLSAVATDLRDVKRPNDQLVMSIAAGITLDSLRIAMAPTRAIVRVMPNQPALVGAGMSVLTATAETTDAQRGFAQYVAEAIGCAEWIEDESLMDAVTAISGSGPAYFYLLMELIENAGRKMGLPAELARTLTRQTGYGAGLVATKSDLDMVTLRESVTSKGGTTAAALEHLEQMGIRDIVDTALRAARDRSIELGATTQADRDAGKSSTN